MGSMITQVVRLFLVALLLFCGLARADVKYTDCTNIRGSRLPSTIYYPIIYISPGNASDIEGDPARYRAGKATSLKEEHFATPHSVCLELSGSIQSSAVQSAAFESDVATGQAIRFLYPTPPPAPKKMVTAACAPLVPATTKQRVYVRNARSDTVFCAEF